MSDTVDDLARRLTTSAGEAYASMPVAEREAIQRYQGLDRVYAVVHAVLRGEQATSSLRGEDALLVASVIDGLDAALRRWSLPEPVRVYRGVRDPRRVFGADRPKVGRGIEPAGFLSTSLDAAVALQEFTKPAAPSGGALLEIDVSAGTPAIWVPPVGDPALAYQQELILDRGTRLRIGSSRHEAGTVAVICEVIP